MPGGRPFLRSASFCGNSGTMKASLVSTACKAVDAMKIARAKVAATAKDLARRTVMDRVRPPLPRRGTCPDASIGAPRRIPARLARAARARALSTNAAVVYSRLGAANGRQLRHSHTDVIAADEG